jgi:transaldolase
MIQGPQRTLLEQLASYVAVDADTLEVDYITSLPITPHDVTSNPRFVHDQLADTNNKEMVEQVVKELKDAPWDEIYAVIVSGSIRAPLVHELTNRADKQIRGQGHPPHLGPCAGAGAPESEL